MPEPVCSMNGNLFITIQTTRHIQAQDHVKVAMVVMAKVSKVPFLSLASIVTFMVAMMIIWEVQAQVEGPFKEQGLISGGSI